MWLISYFRVINKNFKKIIWISYYFVHYSSHIVYSSVYHLHKQQNCLVLHTMLTSFFNKTKPFVYPTASKNKNQKKKTTLAAVHFTGNVSLLQYPVGLGLLCASVRHVGRSFSSSQRELSCWLCCLLPTRGVHLYSGSHSRRRTGLYMTLGTAVCKRNHRY